MRVQRKATAFEPVIIVLETREDVNQMICAVNRAQAQRGQNPPPSGDANQIEFHFLEGLRATLGIVIDAPASIDANTDHKINYENETK